MRVVNIASPIDTSIATVPEAAWNCSTSWLSGWISFLPGNEETGDDVVMVGGDPAVPMATDGDDDGDDDTSCCC